ncbi:hypothetical protein [Serratia sp. Ag1]|uniref:hypothetical protein n=1 Tax=Serratia sp. Ag1 TaxID=1524467 RepID=UPI000503A2AA|nr:hypothetical protein [Serratia sp. Ag1]KFK93808.1 hypothetical protein IV04_23565 [Serratia sp. Ag1]
MTDAKNDYLSAAAAELSMQQAALISLIEYWHNSRKDEEDRRLVTENLLYNLEGGLERTWNLLEQESRYRMARGKQ